MLEYFFKEKVEKIQVGLKSDKIMNTLHEQLRNLR